MSFTAFELTPTDGIFESLFTYTNYDAHSARLESLGFETYSTGKNMGLLAVLLATITALYLILLAAICLQGIFEAICYECASIK